LEQWIEVYVDSEQFTIIIIIIRLIIIQGSVATQTVLGGLTIHHPVANFL